MAERIKRAPQNLQDYLINRLQWMIKEKLSKKATWEVKEKKLKQLEKKMFIIKSFLHLII